MILGIDLGTTNSLGAIWRNGRTELIPNVLGSVLTPSAVSVSDDGTLLVGLAARERLVSHPALSAAAFKRAMGTQRDFRLGDRSHRAEELSALVLRALKEDAERYLGESVTEAVITVPAYFSDAQRKATRAAGQLAGLNVLRLLNEPTAAALAYGLHEGPEQQHILVLDLGGGTFDVSILEMFDGVMEVRATAGDNVLGGEDFVSALMDGFLADVGQAAGIPPRSRDDPIHGMLRRAAEVAKRALTDTEECDLVLAYRGAELRWTVNRERFAELSAPLVARLRKPVERALRDARLAPAQINHVILVGGATRMPLFRRLVARMFQRLPVSQVNPDEVVARGAAIQAGLLARDTALQDHVMTDVAPFTMGVEVANGRSGQVLMTGLYLPVIERNTVIPASRSVRVHTLVDGQRVVLVRVFQGEARLTQDNIALGELRLGLPPAPAGQESIEIRFTYDTSGLLEVEATVETTGETQSLVVENESGTIPPDQIKARLAALAHLKVHPRDQAENQAVLARAERLYAERVGEERGHVAIWLDSFRQVIERQDPTEIAAFRAELIRWLDTVDVSFFS